MEWRRSLTSVYNASSYPTPHVPPTWYRPGGMLPHRRCLATPHPTVSRPRSHPSRTRTRQTFQEPRSLSRRPLGRQRSHTQNARYRLARIHLLDRHGNPPRPFGPTPCHSLRRMQEPSVTSWHPRNPTLHHPHRPLRLRVRHRYLDVGRVIDPTLRAATVLNRTATAMERSVDA